MNGEILRGEVYWVRDALTNGAEEAFKRPFVVISNNKHNEKLATIIGACLTTKVQRGPVDVFVKSTSRPSWAMCDHIIEIDKSRVMEYSCTCSKQEMEMIDDALRFSLGLGEEAAETAIKVEADMYKKLYEKALDELVKLKLQLELSEKCDKLREKPVKKVVADKVNINTADAEAIAIMLDIPETTAYLITGYRRQNGNFVDIEELRDVIGLPKDFVEKYGDKITIGEENITKSDEIKTKSNETEIKTKVNVNTATPGEIHEKTGLNIDVCNKIRAYRNKNGPFTKVEDLLNVARFGSGCMQKYGHLLEV